MFLTQPHISYQIASQQRIYITRESVDDIHIFLIPYPYNIMKIIQLLSALPLVSAFSIDASSRRGFLTQSTAAIASLVAVPIVAHAEDVDDLAMPSEEDEKARIVSIPSYRQVHIN